MKREAVSVFIAIVIASSFIGIFTDAPKLGEELCGITIGFWKTNAAKDLDLIDGEPQVKLGDYLDLLGCVDITYGKKIDDWHKDGWNIKKPIKNTDLEWALHWLSYGAYDPATNGFTNPESSDSKVKARGQLLALLLTACYRGKDYTDASIYVPENNNGEWQTVSNWITDIIGYYNEGDYDVAHYIANYLNEHCAQPYIY